MSSFVRSRQQLVAVASSLSTARLVTLTGVGGIGKTRLALRVANEVGSEYAHGAWLATLDAVVDGASVGSAVAAALGCHGQFRCATAAGVGSSALNNQLLLVLDNCEHVAAACAELVLRLLQECGGLRVLATSRKPLGVPGEVVYPVAPLQLSNAEELLPDDVPSEAVQLFVERAQARTPQFALSPQTREIANRICRSVDGIPLAIELAAARVSSMTMTEIARRLDDPLSLLTVGARTAPVRQQTLRASLDWSYELLQPAEQQLLRRIAIFSSGFVLEVAEAVCAADDLPAADILDLLDRLVAQSLVHTVVQDETTRFSLSKSVRQYCFERLRQTGEVAALRKRHRDWCLSLAGHVASGPLGPDQVGRLEVEEENLRSAFGWATESDGAEDSTQLALGLGSLWLQRGRNADAQSWLTALTSRASSRLVPPEMMLVANTTAHLVLTDGDPEVEGRAPDIAETEPAETADNDGLAERPEAPVPALPKRGTARTNVLSKRECDVAVLVASGRSNREIAEELVITTKTAEAHIGHILNKLGLWSRVQIATWSLQHGLGPTDNATSSPSLAATRRPRGAL